MPDWILPLAVALSGLILGVKTLPYWLGPALIKATCQVLAEAEVKTVPADRLPNEVAAFFAQVEQALEKQGLKRIATLELRTAPKGEASYAAMVLQPEGRIMGMAAALHQPGQGWHTYMEFSSELTDGTILTTNNAGVVSPYKPSPHTETLQFPWVDQPDALFRLHRSRIAHARMGAPKLPPAGQELAFVREAIAKPVRAQAEFGYFKLDAAAGLYRLTWRGACRMTWHSLAPLKGKREAEMREKATAFLKTLKADKAAARRTA